VKKAVRLNLKTLILLVYFFTVPTNLIYSQISDDIEKEKSFDSTIVTDNTKWRLNFFVANKINIHELLNQLVILRARIHGVFHRDRMKIVLARNSEEACSKMLDYLKDQDAMIGHIWFDSHGHYIKNGYSSFLIGIDEFSYKTINDTSFTKYLSTLAPYSDEHTKLIVGSCYGGATFERPPFQGKSSMRMNGDSLMIGLANIFRGSLIFGTESWIMTKPGLFTKNSFALAGYPLGKKNKRPVYRPIWERMGIWHSYSSTSKKFIDVNTISLTRNGSIHINSTNYLDWKKHQNKVDRILRKIDKKILRRQQDAF
jgi:hypothetical protein